MQYRKDRTGREISVLGYGCMRFSRQGSGIDQEKAERELLRAIELGVNYLDTAYIYPGSEACLGEILEHNHLRDRVLIATKLPQYMIKSLDGVERYFREQLQRLRTDHIDYYLMHMLTDVRAWQQLRALGIEDWLAEKQRTGAIGQVGFSFHGNTDMFLQILEQRDWDFCQIQYNYMDENSQAGRKGLQAAAARGIPVMIMEPLRGGKLVNLLPGQAQQVLEGSSAASLAFRWLWDQPEVTCVLSGMNSLEMVEENCRTADSAVPGCLSEAERGKLEALRTLIQEKLRIGCTGCGYCMPCPNGVDIPTAFRCYNEMAMESKSAGRHEYFQVAALRRQPVFPSQCVGCGKCERHCPQHLPIIQTLKEADRALLPPVYRMASAVARKWLFRKDRKEKE